MTMSDYAVCLPYLKNNFMVLLTSCFVISYFLLFPSLCFRSVSSLFVPQDPPSFYDLFSARATKPLRLFQKRDKTSPRLLALNIRLL